MSKIIGFNGKALETHFDCLATVSLEVDYILNQLRSVRDYNEYFLIVDSEFRNIITLQFKSSNLTRENILRQLENIVE